MDFTDIKNTLETLGYKVSCFDSAKEAADYLNREIDGTTVGFGGSQTLHEMGLFEMLSEHNQVSWHHHTVPGQSVMEARIAANAAKVYLTSVNAIAKTGEIVNIDGMGNRIAATLFGPEKVYMVVGENKITPDYDSALYRARNVASPKNAQRMGLKTPCAVKGDRCYDCKSPERVCRGLCVFWENLMGSDTEIVLIGESLGY